MTIEDWKKNRAVLSAPPQNAPRQKLSPVFDFHRKYWKRRIPYVIESDNFNNEGKTKKKSALAFFEKPIQFRFFLF